MDKITDLTQYKLSQSPHISGPIICLACKHEWIGVCPAGTIDMECPNCHLFRGVHKYQVLPASKAIWTCNCGNNLFFISELNNAICPSCGVVQNLDNL